LLSSENIAAASAIAMRPPGDLHRLAVMRPFLAARSMVLSISACADFHGFQFPMGRKPSPQGRFDGSHAPVEVKKRIMSFGSPVVINRRWSKSAPKMALFWARTTQQRPDLPAEEISSLVSYPLARQVSPYSQTSQLLWCNSISSSRTKIAMITFYLQPMLTAHRTPISA
jgi:hypothetical protein